MTLEDRKMKAMQATQRVPTHYPKNRHDSASLRVGTIGVTPRIGRGTE